MERFQEIARRLRDGRSLREIACVLNCSRKTVREVRDGLRLSPAIPAAVADPLWMSQLHWSAAVHERGLGHPLKFIWEECAQSLTGYPNFWKQFHRKFPQLLRLGSIERRRGLTATARGLRARPKAASPPPGRMPGTALSDPCPADSP